MPGEEEAIWGENAFGDAQGLLGLAAAGVRGETSFIGGAGVEAVNTNGGAGGLALAVSGNSNFTNGTVTVTGDVNITGALTATGGKAFIQPHPTDPGLEVVFIAMESDEANTIFRGTTTLVNGEARIVPNEAWRLVTAEQGITAFATPRGNATVWIESESRDLIVLRGTADVPVNYFVIGLRAGFEFHEVIQPNTHVIPTYRGEPYAAESSVEYQRILIQNGTLNNDLTPNEATALRLGWVLKDRDEDGSRPGSEGRAGRSSSNRYRQGDDRPERPAEQRGGRRRQR